MKSVYQTTIIKSNVIGMVNTWGSSFEIYDQLIYQYFYCSYNPLTTFFVAIHDHTSGCC